MHHEQHEDATLESTLPCIDRSKALLTRCEALIPARTQTLAKGPGQYVRGVSPVFAQRGKGAHIWDVDGNRYLDYTMAVGPLVLGYGNDVVDAAIREQLNDGITFSLMHPLEVEVAELITEMVPSLDMVRYSKTGCDVTTAAVRLARAYTGKSTVLCCGYHGWHDWYIGTTDRSMGIPQQVKDLTYTFTFNDIESVRQSIDDDTAAIILEPMVVDEPNETFLHDLRELCTQRGIVLIFDEMWTGFRIARGGAQERFGVTADLVCYSKAIANGMPLSVLAGRADIMRLLDRDVFFFTTFGGEALSLAAARATMQVLRDEPVLAVIEQHGNILRDQLNALISDYGIEWLSIKGLGSRTMLAIARPMEEALLVKSYIHQELLRCGILWNGFHNLSYAHRAEDIEHTLEAYADVLPRLQDHMLNGKLADQILGTPMEPVFRRTGNFNTKPRLGASA